MKLVLRTQEVTTSQQGPKDHNIQSPAFVTIGCGPCWGVVPSCVLGIVPASSGILVLFCFNLNKTKFLSFKNEAGVKNTRSHNFPTRPKRPQCSKSCICNYRLWALLGGCALLCSRHSTSFIRNFSFVLF